MQFLSAEDIDKDKWDEKILQSSTENIFCYSWYLDAVSKNWGALIEGDYDTILPIPFSKVLGIKEMIQPPFTRELDIFGNDFDWSAALAFLSKDFKALHFRNQSNSITDHSSERKHQLVNLSVTSNYSTNAKRLIKKAQHFLYESYQDPKELISLFKGTAWSKIDSISEDDLIRLENLMNEALARKQGDLIGVYDNGILIASGFFLLDKKRVTYLKGAATDEGKKAGAMFGLMDHAMNKYRSAGYQTFDFGGSDVENVANFYKKFGAEDRIYFDHQLNNLPLWFKTLKKLKG